MLEPFVVAYLGGSITWGSGASEPERTSYRALVTEYLRNRYPDRNVVEVNAAVGGTGSDFGLFRLRRDVLDASPNLVFVEFAVNDHGMEPEWRRRSFESLLRALLGVPNPPRVVVLLTTLRADGAESEERHRQSCRDHRLIAEHYEVPVVDAGASLQARCVNQSTADRLLPDGVHPSDAGYRVYADAIIGELAALSLERPPPRDVAPLQADLFETITMVAADGNPLALGLPVVDLQSPYMPRAWQIMPGDASLRLEVEGRVFGLAWWVSSDSGSIRWRVDGGEWTEAACWDEYARHFNRIHYVVLPLGSSNKNHRLEIVASDRPVMGSEGLAIRIGAFFVAG